MKLTHLGHACLLVDSGDARLLIDPGVLSSFADVRDLDAILITHQHADHVDLGRLAELLEANPRAALVADRDTAPALTGLTRPVVVAGPGDRLELAGAVVEVLGGLHAAVFGDVPGCTNAAYLIDGALLHPGDSFVVPDSPVEVLAVPIDAPWLKLSEAVDYVRAVAPRVAVPIHEGETTDPGKLAGMLEAFSDEGVVRRLAVGEAVAL
ncbi:MBL fold metallo-hydrolase [Demequina salsinemoris]|uniref:MBL fold metallo-hydrolase n=1 Tax=Demequina salsinemoris TaxID=577470 RepID=UPI000781D38D|nr:MBL fold metallo-hydrolase [Demequina salsinemoris]